MKKKIFLVLPIMLLLLILVACGSNETTGSNDNNGKEVSDETVPNENVEQPTDIIEVEMVTFQPPSLGAFFTPIIETHEFDLQNGVDIIFTERPPDAYNTEFASGQFKVGGSAALLSEGLRTNRGVEVSYLFNVFDFFGTVITANEEIQEIKDLENKSMAVAQSSTNYAMFQYFAQKADVDFDSIEIFNAATPALVTFAEANRADAVQLWEPAFSTLMNKNPDKYHEVDIGLDKWEEYTGVSESPYLGIAAHQDWIDENHEAISRMYKTYKDAAEWLQSNPEEAAKLIANEIPEGNADVIQNLIENNELLGLNIMPASELEESIEAVFELGLEINYFDEMPEDSVIYSEPLK